MTLGVLAVLPAAASAITFSITGTTINSTADTSTNDVVVTVSGSNYAFTDTSDTEDAGTGCSEPVAGTVLCPLDPTTAVNILLGTGDDSFTAAGVNQDPFTIDGGDGDDGNILGSDANDVILGGPSSDNDNAAVGLNGGLGNDRIDGGTNGGTGDLINGGSGIDRVLWSTCGAAATVTIGVTAGNDGCTDGSGDEATDTVGADIESMTGTAFGDTITGTCSANTFAGSSSTVDGGDGADTFNGDPNTCNSPSANGDDFFGGGEGADDFNGDGTGTGAAGFDTVTYGFPYTGVGNLNIDWGGGNDDTDGYGTLDDVQTDIERVIGNTGNDTINATGAAQAVSLFGRDGTDTLTDSPFGDFMNGEGGADTYNCVNGGTDTIVQDGGDTVNGC
jgi:hypothetical protein